MMTQYAYLQNNKLKGDTFWHLERLVSLVVAWVLFCALALSFFLGFADKAPHSMELLLQEVISLDGRRRRRSGKGGVSQTLVSD